MRIGSIRLPRACTSCEPQRSACGLPSRLNACSFTVARGHWKRSWQVASGSGSAASSTCVLGGLVSRHDRIDILQVEADDHDHRIHVSTSNAIIFKVRSCTGRCRKSLTTSKKSSSSSMPDEHTHSSTHVGHVSMHHHMLHICQRDASNGSGWASCTLLTTTT